MYSQGCMIVEEEADYLPLGDPLQRGGDGCLM